ncbi:MAG: agmatine deiminase family protein [Muribaculaceae bacterium]|nr:agmatine deiminase family protein [Muribaculaceae bacterium]
MITKTNRFPAEWERHGAVMLSWPHSLTDWNYMLEEVRACYCEVIRAIIAAGEVVILIGPESELADEKFPEGVYKVYVATNDTWIRDYGPLTLSTPDGFRLLDFRFNGWGLKFAANFDNQVNRNLGKLWVYSQMPISCKDLVFEGGSIESDGSGTLLTTEYCLMAPNRNEPMTRGQVESVLLQRLHGRKLLWITNGGLAGDDTDGHVDTLCRLAPGNSLVYVGCQDPDDEHFESLQAMAAELREFTNADGDPFNLIELPLPDPIYDAEGQRLPATYANYLVLERAVLLPVYNQPMKDKLAAEMLRIVFPDREIVSIDCRALIQQHGSLHCATMQIPSSVISFL